MSLGEKSLKPHSSAMAFSSVFRYITFSLLCLCSLSIESVDEKPPFSFSFERFEKDRSFGSQIALYGDAEISNSTVRIFGKGQLMYKKPIRFLGTNPGFSNYFSFSISAAHGESLAFFLVPNVFSLTSRIILAVKFAADPSESHIAIDVGGEISAKSINPSVFNLVLGSGQKLHSWIDYDGFSKIIEVRVSKSRDLKPEKSLVSCPVDLSNVLWREAMYVGISSSSGNTVQTSCVYSWSFRVKHGAPYLMHSEPLDPESVSVRSHEDCQIHARRSSPWKILVALLVGAVCGALATSTVFLLLSKVVKRHPVAPVEYPVLPVETEKIVLDGNKGVGIPAK